MKKMKIYEKIQTMISSINDMNVYIVTINGEDDDGYTYSQYLDCFSSLDEANDFLHLKKTKKCYAMTRFNGSDYMHVEDDNPEKDTPIVLSPPIALTPIVELSETRYFEIIIKKINNN